MGLWSRRREEQIDILREAENLGGPGQERSKGDRGGKQAKLQRARDKAAEKQRRESARKMDELNRASRTTGPSSRTQKPRGGGSPLSGSERKPRSPGSTLGSRTAGGSKSSGSKGKAQVDRSGKSPLSGGGSKGSGSRGKGSPKGKRLY